jgi:hypothetical protein
MSLSSFVGWDQENSSFSIAGPKECGALDKSGVPASGKPAAGTWPLAA